MIISVLEKTLKIFPYSYTFIDIAFFVGHWNLIRMFSYWYFRFDSSHLSRLSFYGLLFGFWNYGLNNFKTTLHQLPSIFESIIDCIISVTEKFQEDFSYKSFIIIIITHNALLFLILAFLLQRYLKRTYILFNQFLFHLFLQFKCVAL